MEDDTLAGSSDGSSRSTDDTLAGNTDAQTRPTRRATALASGDLVARYVVLAKLGAGGMGVVYAAYDPELDRKVALKLLRFESGSRSQGRSRLLREAQALAKFTHPEIVTVHDVGEHEAAIWLAMEFVDGRTLGAWAEQTTPDWRDVLAVMLAAGRGVAAAHAAGMVHRDLKPDNIMVGHDGRVRVMDFGLTRLHGEPSQPTASDERTANSFTRHGSLLGTPAYMAPEQFEGEEASAASDQFAYCVTMWELLYGERPFAGRSTPEIANAVIAGKLRSPPKGRRVPSWLRRVCERGLARAPAERWPSMPSLLAALERGQSRVRTRRLVIGLGLIAGLIGGAEGVRRYDRAQRIAACEAAGASIDATWNDEARARVRAGLTATKVAYAETTAGKVMPYLDERAAAWREHRTSACRYAEVDRTWTATTLDRAVWCLDERQLEFESLVEELARADAQLVQTAVSAAAGLARVEPCVDELVLRNLPEPPTDESREAIGELRRRLARVGTSLATGKIPEGLALVREARIEAEALGWPPLLADARRREGELLYVSGEFAAAEAMSLAAYVEAAKASVWAVAADAAIDLTVNVGDRQARPAEGRVWAKHAEVAIAHTGDPLGFRAARRATTLAHVELSAGDYDQAEALYQRALTIWTEAFGPEHPMVGASFNDLGNVHRVRLDYAQAKLAYERSLALQEQVLGPEHPDVAAILHNLGVALDGLGDPDAARPFYERALATWDKTLGTEHPSAAATLSQLGTVWFRKGDPEQAKLFYTRALGILETTLGREHPDIASVLNNLANVSQEQGDIEQAKRLHQRALAIREKSVGPEHPAIAVSLYNLAMLHRTLGEHAEAKPLLERALAISETAYGVDHPEVAWILGEIGDADLALGRPNDALGVLERAIVIFDANPGEQGGEAMTRFALTRVLVATGGDRARAVAEAEKARAGFREMEMVAEFAKVEQWLADSGD